MPSKRTLCAVLAERLAIIAGDGAHDVKELDHVWISQPAVVRPRLTENVGAAPDPKPS